MGKHSGTSTDEPPPAPQRRQFAQLAAGLTATVVAWGFLVVKAIQFGADAKGGETPAWLFALFATLGATACMFVALVLGTKALAALRGELPPPRSGGGRRASR